MRIPLKEWLIRKSFVGIEEAVADFGKLKDNFPAMVLPHCRIRFSGVIS